MAWSGNLRCLYCDGKLPLYRKLTSGQFCSTAHSKAYWEDQQRLAVERLHQTHDSLRAYRSPEALEAILGKPAASEPVSPALYYRAGETGEIEHHPLEPQTVESKPKPTESKRAESKPAAPRLESEPEAADIARSASNTGHVTFAGFLTEDKPGLRAWNAIQAAWTAEFALWPLCRPALPQSAGGPPERTLETASGVAMPRFQANGFAAAILAGAEQCAPAVFDTKSIVKVPFALTPETEELTQLYLAAHAPEPISEPVPEVAPQVEETLPPFVEQLASLSKIVAQSVPFTSRAAAALPIETVRRVQNARYEATFDIPAVGVVSELQPLALTNRPQGRAASAGATGDTQAADLLGYSQPLELKSSGGAPWMNLAIPAAGPAMSLASGSRYQIFGGAGDAVAKPNFGSLGSTEALDLRCATASPCLQSTTQSVALSLNTAPGCRYGVKMQPGTIQPVSDTLRSAAGSEFSSVPAPQKKLAAQSLAIGLNPAPPCALALVSQPGTIGPSLGDVQPLAAKNELQIVRLPDGLGRAQRNPLTTKVLPLAFSAKPCAPPAPAPVSAGVEHVYASNAPMNPVAKWEPIEGSATPLRRGILGWTQSFTSAGERKHVWAHAADFWQHAPRDLKLLAIAIPILLGLALRPSLPKVGVTAPSAAEGISKNIGNGFREQFINVRNTVAQRAGVSLNEDFRSGLDDWQSRGNLTSGWSFDQNGFVRPGTLALYRPSMALTDYDMEFLGLIDKKALSWVVRARDFDNYYVVKLMVLKNGPLPTLGITRYAVIDGKAQARVDTTVAINARPDMLYRVSMNVHDDTFLLSLQGTVVDNWTDSRLKRGGVGFFAPKGEESRLRWLQLSHQYDMLGRLCAYLAPYNIPTTNGSW